MTRTSPIPTIRQLLAQAGKRSDALDARVLMQAALGVSRAYLIAHADLELSGDAQKKFANFLERRERGEPVAYIVGTREFYGLDFTVSPAVLIPRPETELLVEAALERLPNETPLTALDLGTGSGCVAIAIARQRLAVRMTAVDCSAPALEIARGNAHRLLGPAHGVELMLSDWFGALSQRRFDLIVANPPYVGTQDLHLSLGDLRFEPSTALIAGADGLEAIRTIVAGAPHFLAPGGWLAFEHGHEQGEAARALLATQGFVEIATLADLASLPRVTLGRLAAV